MAGSITIKERCVVNFRTGKFATGSKEEIVACFAKVRLDETKTLFVTVKGYTEGKYFSIRPGEFTEEEEFKLCIDKAYECILRQPGFAEYVKIY